jgi:p70 ribosomal S6 kinase
VLLFEMLTGSAPFRAKNRAVLQKKILTEKIKYPAFLTSAAHKLLLGLLQRDEVRRWCPTRCVVASER